LEAWLADRLIIAGAISPFPAPAATVPRAVLRHLKEVFDPGQTLPTPDWLTESAVGNG